MKNIPKIEIKTMIGYSNLFNLLSIIKFLDEFKTNKLVIKINILKKFDNSSLTKLVLTDSIEESDLVLKSNKIEVISISSLLGEAIKRISDEKSVSSLFD